MRSEPKLRLMFRSGPVLAFIFGCVACGGGPAPRSANPTRPLDEPRALQIIADAFREQSEQPVPGQEVALSSQHHLRVDVGAQGKRFGVAYLSAPEREALGAALPPRDPHREDALQVVSGIDADRDARICVLYDSDYLHDDQAAEVQEPNALTAELKLRRDVRDFLVIAHRERMP